MMKDHLRHSFQAVRRQTEVLCQPLAIEDYVVQSCEDVSPPKWHLAHSSWFFETFILNRMVSGYTRFHPSFHYLFNSYYQGLGNPYPRAKRGLLSRPTVELVYAYRRYIDSHILSLIEQIPDEGLNELGSLIVLGLHHEQQHQELLMMDIKHNFSHNPDFPAYRPPGASAILKSPASEQGGLAFINVSGGIVEIGYRGTGFCFDNELPEHRTLLQPYSIASGLVSNGDYLEFIAAGGYQEPRWWLADGWDCVLKNQWQAPLYWHKPGNEWHIFTLNGLGRLNPLEPVSHVSYYEADAYTRWRGVKLPTEEEWEHFVVLSGLGSEEGNFMETGLLHPQASTGAHNPGCPQQFYGDLWEWTSSAYMPYPGYQPLKGALGEYNGKFMANQMVLRGGSCVTPKSHIRSSYRNFFQPDKRWHFSGIRLAGGSTLSQEKA